MYNSGTVNQQTQKEKKIRKQWHYKLEEEEQTAWRQS